MESEIISVEIENYTSELTECNQLCFPVKAASPTILYQIISKLH